MSLYGPKIAEWNYVYSLRLPPCCEDGPQRLFKKIGVTVEYPGDWHVRQDTAPKQIAIVKKK